LAGLGGGLGLCFAWWGSNFLLTFLPHERIPLMLRVVPNAPILLFTAGLSLVTGILFGLAPALRATRIDLSPALKATARGLMGGRSSFVLAKGLVVAQVAFAALAHWRRPVRWHAQEFEERGHWIFSREYFVVRDR